jgi:O-antigen/teichoic acid export membrane protein
LSLPRLPLHQLGGLASLYGSRLAGILVTLLFLPLYARLLGKHDFGLVALLMSTQSLMMMLDLGMAALATRDLAAQQGPSAVRARWLRAEQLLTLYFAALAVPGLIATWILEQPLLLGAGCIVLCWAVTLQSLAQAAMLARGDVHRAALVQGGGVLCRAALTAIALLFIEPSVRAFVASQVCGALAHLAINRLLGMPQGSAKAAAVLAEPLGGLARRGVPLFLMGVAGAAVLQLDKLLVGFFMSPAAVTPYFLATTFCLAPISILAGPVAQFFQPRLIRAYASEDGAGLHRQTFHLTLAVLVTVIVPTLILWIAREPIIVWWLHDRELAARVAAMAALLLPAAAIGAVGNVPLALLIAQADFGFQARVSVTLAGLTLLAVAVAAWQGSLMAVCGIYLAYYAAITAALWVRAAWHPTTAGPARHSAAVALIAAGATCLPIAALLHAL